ncbi:MAG: 50S ribosomal protein L13 [Candidatus Spechtbacterales bacterium]
MKYTIDASNKILGRLASEIATLLRGKNQESFLPHVDSGNSVEILNVEKIKVSGNKFDQKMYWRYTGYPGGIRGKTYGDLVGESRGEVLRRAVYGMLPHNKLRVRFMKRLVIT